MKTLPRVIVALFALAFVLAACSSGSGSEWTFAPDAGESPAATSAPGEPTPAASPAEPTAEPEVPSATEAPTDPGEPTATDAPTDPGEPSATDAPTDPGEPTATDAPTDPGEPSATEAPTDPGEPTEPPSGEARVIELEADAATRFLQDGEQIRELAVTPGETVIFRIDNTAGFPHNFYIGSDAELQVMGGVTDLGIPDWDIGVQELQWVVPDDLTGIRFACTIPGHYYTMQGDFVIAP